ncbi:periodic tryptophan protein [Artemisia annua]|uniref:Periodic tryptophan protein n=1 Tax=Artemisia annua TaxID=35608 RepID=A0A2U1PBC0_ARTAN|nr:periodic tryptophan protein [Artemisia annua]
MDVRDEISRDKRKSKNFLWSMKTGRLLDVLSGHEGQVHGLMFSPATAILASSAWDRTVRLWVVFDGKGLVETFSHTHDVLTIVYCQDGKYLAFNTLDGQIHLWDPIDGLLMYTTEGRRDIAGRRLMTDPRANFAAASTDAIRSKEVEVQVLKPPSQKTRDVIEDIYAVEKPKQNEVNNPQGARNKGGCR